MKITPKDLPNFNFITTDSISKESNIVFEEYFRNALLELEKSDFLKHTEKEKIKYLSEKLDFSLDLLDRVARLELNPSASVTVGDFLLSQAFEIDKVAESLPDGGLKSLFKESALYIGIEAEKIRKGYY
ncbi:MAG: hypothetical protein N2Z40_07735 [Caldimicrobium sp.]|nr:hypothetical protein [Caldimicrobium sp.]